MFAEPFIRFPVTCPVCLQETLAEVPERALSEAFFYNFPIPLSSRCHDFGWNAGDVEREQIREYLAASEFTGLWAKAARPPVELQR